MSEKLKNISQVNLRLRRGAVVFGDVVYGPGGACGPRVQRDYQLVVMHRGVLDLRLDNRTIRVPAGHAILLAPSHREHFQFTRDSRTHHSWCAITPAAVPARLRSLFRSLSMPAPFGGRLPVLLDSGKLMVTGDSGNDLLENGYSLALGLALFCEFAREVSLGCPNTGAGAMALARLENVISRQYSQPLRLADMAAAAGISRQHLMKLCRLRGSMTPTQLLYKKRLEAAADLLSHTGLSISEIADRSGFANAYHFSRKFHAAFGKSPREWRRRLWG